MTIYISYDIIYNCFLQLKITKTNINKEDLAMEKKEKAVLSGAAIVMLVAIIALILSACGGVRHARLDTTTPGVVSHMDENFSILAPSIKPQDLAYSDMLEAQAELTRSLAKGQPTSTATGAGGSIIGVIINKDAQETAFVAHPERDIRIPIPPSTSTFLSLSEIPQTVTIYYGHSGERYNIVQIAKHSRIYNGVKCDFSVTIHSITSSDFNGRRY